MQNHCTTNQNRNYFPLIRKRLYCLRALYHRKPINIYLSKFVTLIVQVSLLEYRNRSLQRLSGDGPKPSSSHPSHVSSASSTSNTPTPSTASMSVITTLGKPSTSNVSPSNHPAPVKKSDSTGSNGPSIEPVSPDEDERFPSSRLKMGKLTNSPYEAKLNTLVKMEAGVSLYNRKLSALISEQLLSSKYWCWFFDRL